MWSVNPRNFVQVEVSKKFWYFTQKLKQSVKSLVDSISFFVNSTFETILYFFRQIMSFCLKLTYFSYFVQYVKFQNHIIDGAASKHLKAPPIGINLYLWTEEYKKLFTHVTLLQMRITNQSQTPKNYHFRDSPPSFKNNYSNFIRNQIHFR